MLGDKVKKEQLLVEVDPEIARDEYVASKNGLLVQIQQVKIAETEVSLSKYSLDKSTNMFGFVA